MRLLERDDAAKVIKEYIKDVMQKRGRAPDGKFALLGTSGLMGIGKTALLLHCVHTVVPEAVEELRVAGEQFEEGPELGAKAAYLTFNGGTSMGDRFQQAFVAHGTASYHSYSNAFGSALLACCGVKMTLAQRLDFAESLKLYRQMLKMSAEDSFVLMIDEVAQLNKLITQDGESCPATLLLGALMRQMDEANGMLVFIFSHIRQDVLDEQATDSGREVIPLPLPSLPIDVWRWGLPEDRSNALKAAAAKHPGLHQLLLSLCGHPRSVFDGIAAALKADCNLLTMATDEAVIVARNNIRLKCKFQAFHDDMVGARARAWFDVTEPLSTKELARDGLLLTIQTAKCGEPVELLLPLVLQLWARSCSASPPPTAPCSWAACRA